MSVSIGEGGGGDAGQVLPQNGDSGSADFSSAPATNGPVDGNVQPQQTQEQPNSGGGNPAWDEVLNELPEGFRGLVKPHLEKWDQGVKRQFQERAEEIRRLQEQYKPYEPFIQQKVSPQQLQAAQVLAQQLAQNPQEFWRRVGEHYGYFDEQPEEDSNELEFDEGEQNLDPRVAQQLQQMQQQQEQINQFIQQQYQQQVQAQAQTEIDNELGELVNKYNLSPVDQREVLQRAVIMSQQNPNVSLMDAYQQWDQVKRALFAQQNQTPAPSVLGTSGSHAVQPQKSFAEMSEAEQRAEAAAALRAALGQG